jgi:phage protein D
MSDLATTAQLYSARPVVRIGGLEDPALGDALLSLAVEETTDGLYSLEACFGNWGSVDGSIDYLYFDRAVFDFGAELELELGEGDAAGTVFRGRISALEGRFPLERPPELQVLAEDRLQDLRMTRRTRSFEEVSDTDVFETIAADHGLTTELDLDGPTYPVLAQVNQSDLAFLRERARTADAEVWVEGDTLHAQARARRESATLTLTYGQRLRELSVCADIAHQRTLVAVAGWDVGAKEAIVEEAEESVLGNELGAGTSGPSILRDAFAEREEQLVHCVPLSVDEAASLARAHYRRLARRFLVGHGVAEGDARLRAGTHVELAELGPLFAGSYYVTRVKHTFDSRGGYRTHFCVERPALGGSS